MNSTTKVGIMTLSALALLVYLTFIIGDFSFTKKGYTFAISFYSVNGLSKGAAVSMSGVKIGKVEKIEFQDDQVHVFAYIRDTSLHIRRRSTFTISTAGLMGEKFIEIMPSRDYTSAYIKDGEVVPGTDPTRMDELFEQGNILLLKLQELTASAKDIIGDPEIKENTRIMFRNAREASDKAKEIIASAQERADNIVKNLDSILERVDKEIERNSKDIKALIENVRSFSGQLADLSKDSKQDVRDVIANAKNITDRIDNLIEKLNKNDKLTDDVRAAIDSLKDASANTRDITKEVKEIVSDKEIKTKINRGLDDAHKLAQAVDKVFLNVTKTKIDFKYMLRYGEDSEDFFSDVNLEIAPNDDTFYRIGVEDIGNKDKFNFVIGKDADTSFVKRLGIISSKVGLGIDYYLAKELSISFDAIDTNDTTVRFRAGYLLTDNIKFELRIDDISEDDDRDVNFGLEYKF